MRMRRHGCAEERGRTAGNGTVKVPVNYVNTCMSNAHMRELCS